MQFEKIHNKGQARLFNNRYLEYLTKTHPLVIWAVYMPMIIFMIYYNIARLETGAVKISLLFFSGMFFWSFFEYIIHRYAFHFMAESERAVKIVYLIHGNHHEYPRDKQRLFMPPVPSVILAAVVFFVMYFLGSLIGSAEGVFAFFPGFMLGYLMYGTMHYAIHALNPPFKWMKPLWRNHHLHHYKEQEKGFGVSSTLWDHVFGTMFDLKKEKEDREKVRDIMFISRHSKENVN
ncbi:MAG: sterol desaturase family protein [Ferruginibacter sp.]|nr:sterol desaturase family protein [Ferruginibacter sp.]